MAVRCHIDREAWGVAVAFAVNCFERTYRKVLTQEYVDWIRHEQDGGFDQLYLLVSNVEDPDNVQNYIDRLGDDPGVTVLIVADHLEYALRRTGLRRWMLEPMLWYSAAPLVAVTACREKWLVYWDSDLTLDSPHDWITPSVTKLESNRRLLHANPRWRLLDAKDTLEEETERFEGDFAIGQSFSDQAFLVERVRLDKKIYRRFSVASLRFPTASYAKIFEQRVDAYLNRSHLQRATYLRVTYTHPPGGGSYPTNALTPWRRRGVRLARIFHRLVELVLELGWGRSRR